MCEGRCWRWIGAGVSTGLQIQLTSDGDGRFDSYTPPPVKTAKSCRRNVEKEIISPINFLLNRTFVDYAKNLLMTK